MNNFIFFIFELFLLLLKLIVKSTYFLHDFTLQMWREVISFIYSRVIKCRVICRQDIYERNTTRWNTRLKFDQSQYRAMPPRRVHFEGNKSLRVGGECANVCRTIVRFDQIWFVHTYIHAHSAFQPYMCARIHDNARDIVRIQYTKKGDEQKSTHTREGRAT